MSSNNKVKVLMVGPVNGRLRLLSEKLHSLQGSKAGPFDVCLCSGPFFHRASVTGKEDDPLILKERDELIDEVTWDANDLADGALTFDIPVLFVDVGDGLPQLMKEKLSTTLDALKRDEGEIDLDDIDQGDDDALDNNNDNNNHDDKKIVDESTPKGLFRIATNLYQLVGDDARWQSQMFDGVADIVSVPLPLIDSQMKSNNGTTHDHRQHATSITIGFLGSKIRLPCKSFEEKSKHTSFLGCDILLSGEWGQGMSSTKCGALTAEDCKSILSANGDGENSANALEMMGSYDVAELVATSRPRYHIAPGPMAPVQLAGEDTSAVKLRNRFIASLPYRYPATSSTSGEGSHAGRFLAMGSVIPTSEAKALGKSFKFIHAVGIVPLSYMDANDRESARELNIVVDCPYTDASYSTDNNGGETTMGMSYYNSGGVVSGPGGLSAAQARRLAQEDAASALNGGAFRWQQRPPTRKRHRDGEDGPGCDDDEEIKRQAMEAANPDNTSLFLHGLHRDPGMTLTADALMDAFRPFGCIGVSFPKPKMNHQMQQQQKPSFAFLDFNTHEEALNCLADLKGEAVVLNIMLTLKWSSSPNTRPMQHHHQSLQFNNGIPPPPPSNRRNRLTEAEAADSTTLFLRLPPTIHSTAYPTELETIRLLAQGTIEDELNVGVALDAPDRITAKDEPALRVTIRHPKSETSMNYSFLEFASHAAALTTLVSLTGCDDGGLVKDDKLSVSCLITDDMMKKDISHLQGVTLFWARGGIQTKSSTGHDNDYGLKFRTHHFPKDSRTDCWFCLASPTCEKHLIVAVYDALYITLPKGGVNEHHVLIVPVEHSGDGAMVNRKTASEMDSLKAKLRLHTRTSLKKDLFVFERSIQTKGGYHSHIQCIPVDLDSGSAIQKVMLEMASKAGFRLKEITGELSLHALEDDWSEGYFYAEVPLPGGGDEFRRFIYRAGDESGTVPLEFGRMVLAEVMGNPQIRQWKACVVSQEKETELAAEFRMSLSASCS